MTKQERIFRIAHRAAKYYRAYNQELSYRETFTKFLNQQYRFENEAISDGTIEERIKIQTIMIKADMAIKSGLENNTTILEALENSQGRIAA